MLESRKSVRGLENTHNRQNMLPQRFTASARMITLTGVSLVIYEDVPLVEFSAPMGDPVIYSCLLIKTL